MNKHYGFISQQIISKNGLNATWRIGSLMEAMIEIKPMTKEEWRIGYNKYSAENKLPLKRTIEEAYKIAITKRPEITREDVFECFKTLIIDKTWEGRQRELHFEKWFKNRSSYEIIHANSDLDRKYGVDFLIYDKNKMIGAIQVKPESYFRYSGDDYDRNQEKYWKFKQKFGVKVNEVAFEGTSVCYGLKSLKPFLGEVA